jgi:hypothetical protein
MVEYGAPQISDDSLADAHHEIEAHPGRRRDDRGEPLVEELRVAAAETAVDDVLQPAAEGEHAPRRDQQRRQGDRDANAIGPEKAPKLHRAKKRT